MKIIIFGATGMVGHGVLLECLEHAGVSSVLVVGRRSCGITHPKLREHVQADLSSYPEQDALFAGYDACFFCLGVSSAGMDEAEYRRVTHDLALAAARAMVRVSPQMTFCYVSGAGTDSSGKGRSMWARVKGQTENALLELPFRASYMFRPGYIQPVKGVRSRTRLYQAIYTVAAPLFPVWKAIAPRHVTTTERLGLAMIHVVGRGYSTPILEAPAINELAETA
jgi:uncharacterized protein YbjT (DUF2867 family)